MAGKTQGEARQDSASPEADWGSEGHITLEVSFMERAKEILVICSWAHASEATAQAHYCPQVQLVASSARDDW